MTKKNEQTSKRVAGIAGKVLDRLKNVPPTFKVTVAYGTAVNVCTVADLKSLAASALTQTRDRKR